MPGGGLVIPDIPLLKTREFHIAAHRFEASGMQFRRPDVTMGANGMEYSLQKIDEDLLRRVLEFLN